MACALVLICALLRDFSDANRMTPFSTLAKEYRAVADSNSPSSEASIASYPGQASSDPSLGLWVHISRG